MKKKIFSNLTVCLLTLSLSLSAFAHSGRTDGSGGHKDNKNKSGLGPYHYHCGGYPPHLHSGGVCPYKSGSSSGSAGSSASAGTSTSSGGSTYTQAPQKVYATGITPIYVPSSIYAGETVTLKASVYPTNAEDKTISWESSDETILEVTSSGELTPVGIGTTTVTAKTTRGTSQKFTITVKEVEAEQINITAADKEILVGETKVLECEIVPKNTTDKTIEWKSSDEEIISVLSDGTIIAKNVGIATITAIHKELSDSVDIEVKPIEAQKIEIILPDDISTYEGNSIKINMGSEIKLETEIYPDNTTYKDIEWSVSDETIASIDEKGVLMPKTTGSVVVTAKAKSGVIKEIEFEILENDENTTAGIIGLAAIVGAGIAWYRKKKKKEVEE